MTSPSKINSGIRGLLLCVVSLAIVNLTVGQERMCGSKLRNVIDIMCPHGINGHENSKRSSFSLDDEDLSKENTEEDFNLGSNFDMLPFFRNMENNGIAKMRRRRHGIAHECCVNICTPKQVLKYCKQSSY